MVILLLLALLMVALVAVAPREATEIRRDREEETIHRGTEYARAVKRFYRRIGRYPTRIEELEKTNNMRFLRKRFKDPITGQDFRLLHFGEQKSTPKGLFGAAIGATGTGVGAPAGGGLPGAIIGNTFGGGTSGGPSGGMSGGQPTSPGTSPGTPASSLSQPLGGSGPTFGGGPIIGVAGTKDQMSIKDWNGKSNYKDWEFYYDPRFDQQQGAVGAGVGGIGTIPGSGQPGVNPSPNPTPAPQPMPR
jgi:type II secretory pathway pseudopilin PulG